MRSNFALDLFKENASRWINLSRCSREFVDGKNTSMDREFVEKLSRQILESFDGLKMR